jgi:hypothetical protein
VLKHNRLLFQMALMGITFFGVLGSHAHASAITFSCSSQTACGTQSVTASGGNFSASGITELLSVGPSGFPNPFDLTFNTAMGGDNISLIDSIDGATLMGSITSFTDIAGPTSTLDLHVIWDVLPAAFSSFLGSPTGIDIAELTLNVSSGGGPVTGANTLIDPTPEPASLALLGSGLIIAGCFFRRRIQTNA